MKANRFKPYLYLTALLFLAFTAVSDAKAVTFTKSDIGSPGAAGTYSLASGIYTVGGAGTGVSLGTDNFTFVSTPATGAVEFIAKVNSQTATSAYAVAGLMVRDSTTSATAQTAMVSVSPQNGVNFTSRLTDGTTATKSLGPSIATSTWLRIVVSGRIFKLEITDGRGTTDRRGEVLLSRRP